jgi:hypothetical protein
MYIKTGKGGYPKPPLPKSGERKYKILYQLVDELPIVEDREKTKGWGHFDFPTPNGKSITRAPSYNTAIASLRHRVKHRAAKLQTRIRPEDAADGYTRVWIRLIHPED